MSAEPEAGWHGFRAQFPVLEHHVYLNAGTEGPMPAAAATAVSARLERDLALGRIGTAYIEEALALAAAVRENYATVLGATVEEVALTQSTTSGINTVLAGLRFAPGDEIVTSDEEYPGLLASLRRLGRSSDVEVRVAPFRQLSAAVTGRTRLIACSHVSWISGDVVDVSALMSTGVPVLLDGAQALGAIPLDVHELGVDFYAGSGQKWLCGPEGTGTLYVRADRLDDLEPPWPGYGTVADPEHALTSELAATTARLDIGFPASHNSAWLLAAAGVFESYGWDWVHSRAAFMASMLADELTAAGVDLVSRGVSTLVVWRPRDGDADAEVRRLGAAGILVRAIPGAGLVRASCGAWTLEEDVAALVGALRR